MGRIVNEADDAKIHGEARRESFVVYTDFGHDSIEVGWEEIHNFAEVVQRLQGYHKGGKEKTLQGLLNKFIRKHADSNDLPVNVLRKFAEYLRREGLLR